ncbi:MAG TPA: hypothetical protein VHX39_00910 [Acetobacteraceae bacterium]|jgi:hypothetical protein|nr:hypothetical protein [Acetobacteraceae bacterium]
MRPVNIGFGTVAFELDPDADRRELIDAAGLRRLGVSEPVIKMHLDYGKRHRRADLSADPGDRGQDASNGVDY